MVGYSFNLKMNKKTLEWLETLLQSKFFGPCCDHQDLRKNEMNVFCIDCNCCVCQHCLSSSVHHLHKLLQIRRYVYHDVVRLHDMHKYLDCSKVQPYTINGAKVVFLNPRPQSRPSKSNSGASCKMCERSLSEPNRYCSIACKVSEILEKSKIRSSSYIPFTFPEFSAISAKENRNPEQNLKEEESSSSGGESSVENQPRLCSALKPKKQLHKRKGIPSRAPFC
ncbi:hypothetical protein HHK36_014772 [Tetracentron sinense]|uniref:B box-type domain-containing protein n=1 Tax=Tetracentron sinense TaxID=13715 RepID=A0A835DD09_TETSI|nr:hypothetical protein HHK36_014772 [Tetracentron sinense]